MPLIQVESPVLLELDSLDSLYWFRLLLCVCLSYRYSVFLYTRNCLCFDPSVCLRCGKRPMRAVGQWEVSSWLMEKSWQLALAAWVRDSWPYGIRWDKLRHHSRRKNKIIIILIISKYDKTILKYFEKIEMINIISKIKESFIVALR